MNYLISISIILILSLIRGHYDDIYPTPEEYAVYACTKDPMTYVIEIKIHSQKQVAESIQAVFNNSSDKKMGLHANSLSYFGDVIDELNDMLMKFKVQIHLNLDAPIIEEFMTDINFDKSCELRDPVAERTDAAYNILQEKYKTSIGLHLFVWSCPVINSSYTFEENFMHDTCGRVMGVLWIGTEPTKDLIKNQIMYALTGIKGDFTSAAAFNVTMQGPLCLFVNKCLARNSTDIGQKVYGEKYLKYTEENVYE